MLIVKESQVQYCEVLRSNDGNIEKVPGISYEKRLFTSDRSFKQEDREAALTHCRQVFSKTQEQQRVLLVENDKHASIWVENPKAKKIKSSLDTVSRFNLEKIVAQMRNVGGVRIKNRNYRFKEYPDCFLGTEAVRWFMRKLQITHSEALQLGQKLIDEKWFHHVSDGHNFKDEELFYRFYWDEN